MKKLLMLMLVLMLAIVPAAASALIVPDFGAFAGDWTTDGVEQCDDYTCYGYEFTYTGDGADQLFEGYAWLLDEKYAFKPKACFSPKGGAYEYRIYVLAYDGKETSTPFEFVSGQGWGIAKCDALLVMAKEDGNAVMLYYVSNDFVMQDDGWRYKKEGSDSVRSASAAPTPCEVCGGTGEGPACSACGGDGLITCISCSRPDKDHDSCSICGGDGLMTCLSCRGKGKTAASCSACGGDGMQ